MKKNNKKGLSLIEVMIACLALGVMMIPTFMMLKSGNTNTAMNKSEILAQAYAANILNYVIATQMGAGDKQEANKGFKSLNGVEIDLGRPEGEYEVTGVEKVNMPINANLSGNDQGNVLDVKTGNRYALYVVTINWKVPSNKTKKGTLKMAEMVRIK